MLKPGKQGFFLTVHSNDDLSNIIKSPFLPSDCSSSGFELQMGNAGLTSGEVRLVYVRPSSNMIVEIEWGSLPIPSSSCGLGF